MSDSHQAHGDGHDEHSHGTGVYWQVFGGLGILTVLSFIVGNWEVTMSRPLVGWSLMMAISCGKALLVISFFMHLVWEANWKYVLTIPASIMSIFLVLMLIPDVGRRPENYSEERYRFTAKEPHEHAEDHGHDEQGHDEQGHDEHVDDKQGNGKHQGEGETHREPGDPDDAGTSGGEASTSSSGS